MINKNRQYWNCQKNVPMNFYTIIRLYSYRFRTECMFRELKQQTGVFYYHFWPKAMPKLSYYQKKEAPSVLEQVISPAPHHP